MNLVKLVLVKLTTWLNKRCRLLKSTHFACSHHKKKKNLFLLFKYPILFWFGKINAIHFWQSCSMFWRALKDHTSKIHFIPAVLTHVNNPQHEYLPPFVIRATICLSKNQPRWVRTAEISKHYFLQGICFLASEKPIVCLPYLSWHIYLCPSFFNWKGAELLFSHCAT